MPKLQELSDDGGTPGAVVAKTLAARKVSYVYEQDKEALVQLRAALQNRVVIVAGAINLIASLLR